MSETTRIRYLGPLSSVALDHRAVGGSPDDSLVLNRGETVEVPFVEYAEQLKAERPEQFDSGEPEVSAAPPPLTSGGE